VVAVADALKQPKKTTSSSRLLGREGGGGGRGVGNDRKKPPPTHLDAREVVVADMLERPKKKTTSDSRLNAREVVVVAEGLKQPKRNHLQLAFGREGGGGGRAVRVVVVGFESPSLGWILSRWSQACCRHLCCGLSLLRCDYTSSSWCCWRFSSALRSLRRRRV